MSDLPAELWTHVFDLAADEDVIFQHGLPTTISPQDALDLVQRRSYATKKAVVRTSKNWRRLGSEFLFRCLFFNDPVRLQTLCAILDSSSSASTTTTASLGWWTRRIHLTRFNANPSRGTTSESLQDALTSIIRHCPNLEIFIIDWPMAAAIFGPIADTLATFTSKSLRTLHLNVPSSALPKVIWALDSLPNLFALHIELALPEENSAAAEDTPLGAASNIHLRLAALTQLSLRGHIQAFLEQATGWTLPSLGHLALDCDASRNDLPDAPAFLALHGTHLRFLDLDALPALPLRRILGLCPSLTTLAFNADWHIAPGADDDDEDTAPLAHDRLTSVGLYGLTHAFGVGYAAPESLAAVLVTSANDRAIGFLCEKARFPVLRRVRVLSQSVLAALERADGPAEAGGGMERWDRWWEACRASGVRLEDCTGGLLGELPLDEVKSDEDEDDEDDEEEDVEEESGEEGEWTIQVPPLAPEGGAHLSELRQLLAECRAMDAGRDDNYMFNSDPSYMGNAVASGSGV
ncbi:hypothetical protein C8R43DRAFT_1097724 [Mycena crocata]|nr:hypothetical protein C8R43DRAFT_1097724 [Mycena crocata]